MTFAEFLTLNQSSGTKYEADYFAAISGLAAGEASPLGDNYPDLLTNNWPYQASGKVTMTTSGNDTSAGTGAQSVKIVGIATDWTYSVETLTTNAGTVDTAGEYFAIIAAEVETTGTLKMNANAITFTGAGGQLMGQIGKFHGRMHTAVLATAEGYQLEIEATYTTDTTGGALYLITIAENGQRTVERYGSMVSGAAVESGRVLVDEKSLVIIAAENTTGGAISAGAEIRTLLRYTE